MPIDFPNSPSNGQEHTVGSTTWVYDGSKWNIKTVSAVTNDGMPVGAIMWFAGSAAPLGWLLCNGASYTTSLYASLYSVIGYTFGGSGANFNVPTISATTGIYCIRYTTALGAVTTTSSLITAPVGSMIDWPTTSSYPTGWLRADGSAVSRTTYNDLFVLIGTTYGVGDSSTTFNLPNMAQAGAGSPVTIIKAALSGTVEPSTVAHASSHIRGGSDVVDGDRAQIDFVPSRYTRNSAASGAGADTDLTAHLSGIDNAINTVHTSIQRLGYVERTSNYSVNSSSLAGAANFFSSSITFTANGTSTYVVEYFAYRCDTASGANGTVEPIVVDGSGNAIRQVGFVGVGDGTRPAYGTIYTRVPLVFGAGSQTINLRWIFGNAGNGTIFAGNTATTPPSYLAVYGPVLT